MTWTGSLYSVFSVTSPHDTAQQVWFTRPLIVVDFISVSSVTTLTNIMHIMWVKADPNLTSVKYKSIMAKGTNSTSSDLLIASVCKKPVEKGKSSEEGILLLLIWYRLDLELLERMDDFQADFEGIREAIEKVSLADVDPISKNEENRPSTSGYEGSYKSGSNNYVFAENIADVTVYFSVICAAKYTFVWIGTKTGVLNNMALSMPTPYDQGGIPLSTQIFGAADHSQSSSLAAKLAKRTNKPFYVSWNVPDSDPRFCQAVDRRLFEEIAVKPGKFCPDFFNAVTYYHPCYWLMNSFCILLLLSSYYYSWLLELITVKELQMCMGTKSQNIGIVTFSNNLQLCLIKRFKAFILLASGGDYEAATKLHGQVVVKKTIRAYAGFAKSTLARARK
ncbi:unnamed protein product [Allacma fusca]|uniref:Uncharacterized protein n=1 Tax=Allacma fusca TaxID=39272 RepID=A0A8J2NQR7_9HEXA|nr:unnamed protein product [Allacma fusca]